MTDSMNADQSLAEERFRKSHPLLIWQWLAWHPQGWTDAARL
jgi:hypothetical protein